MEENPAGGSAISYVPALDGLRGVAVSLVLWHHTPFVVDRRLHEHSFWEWSHGGWLGVDLFFVISGYLITTILFQTQSEPHPFRTFWIRRALRIFPIFYFYLLVLSLVVYVFPVIVPDGRYPQTLVEFLPFAAYLANFEIVRTSWFAGEFNILWTLAFEEQFYLLWPLIVFSLSRRSLVHICLSLMILGPVFRVVATTAIAPRAGFVLPLCRSEGLLLGALIAVGLEHPQWRERLFGVLPKLFPVSLVFLLYILVGPDGLLVPGKTPGWWFLFGYSLVSVNLAIVVGTVLAGRPWLNKILQIRPLTYVGRISYGIYLWQWLIGDFMMLILRDHIGDSVSVGLAITAWCGSTLLFCTGTWYLFEKPVLRLKNRFRYHGGPTVS